MKEVKGFGNKVRRDTIRNWKFANPIIPDGQPIVIIDKQIFLCGDGLRSFKELLEIYVDTHSNLYKKT